MTSPLVQNIRKTESIVLKQQQEEGIAELWKSQVDQLRSAISASSQGESDDGKETNKSRIAIILDIEGTITPLYFVTKILFPFFSQNCESFVKKHLTQKVFDLGSAAVTQEQQEQNNDETLTSLEKSMIEVTSEFIKHFYNDNNNKFDKEKQTLENFQRALIQDSLEHTRANRKIPYMKKLQGICWHQAYLDGSIVGDLFSDLVPFLEQSVSDKTNQQEVHIYSSGSIFAQKLLLGYSRFGNLVDDVEKYNIRDYHDTVSAGMKGEASSYQKIYDKIMVSGKNEESSSLICIFVSDSLMELRAARQANNKECIFIPVFAVRSQNPIVSEQDEKDMEFPSIFTMTQITEALLPVVVDENGASLEKKIQGELERMKKDVEKYSVSGNEERQIFN